jgi:hypothetical protein
MFFCVDQTFDQDFPCHWALGNFCVSTDNGWSISHQPGVQVLYKGYADSAPLETLLTAIVAQTEPKLTGNFCVIAHVDGMVQIQTDRYRGFPIYIADHGVNNLMPTPRTAWADSLVTISRDFSVNERKFDVIGTINPSTLDFDQALDRVHTILTNRTQQFLKHNTLPLRVFLSGGVDTILVYSYLHAAGADFELLDYDHFEHDYFWRCNSHHVLQYWAYRQTHHWRESCVLASGTPGDEFMLRNPVSGDFYLRHLGTSINAQAQPHHMQYDYIWLDKNQKQLAQPALLNSTQELHQHLCNIMVNDWQHWHLGNTLHWTPLRDLDIFKIILRLPRDHAIDQIVNNRFSTALIERNLPGGSKLISNQKNTGAQLKNLNRLFS